MTDTARDLIQRMAKELDLYRQLLRDDSTSTHPFADEARALLAQPELEEPTDEEILDLVQEHNISYSLIDGSVMRGDALSFARAVLARWGRPAIEPVPVSERLPGEGDCDPSFQCWWFTPSEEKWILWPIKWVGPECSHWLPHYALPIPTFTETP